MGTTMITESYIGNLAVTACHRYAGVAGLGNLPTRFVAGLGRYPNQRGAPAPSAATKHSGTHAGR
jgi:hypothetical protein